MSHEEPSNGPQTMTCSEVLDLLYLYACEELDPSEMRAIEAHLADCVECTKALDEHKVLRRALPSGFVDRKLFYYSKDA